MRQKIEMSAADKAELAKSFGVSIRSVNQALAFERNSLKSVRIREAAVKKGGRLVEIREVDLPKQTVKVLDAKGNVKAVIVNDTITL